MTPTVPGSGEGEEQDPRRAAAEARLQGRREGWEAAELRLRQIADEVGAGNLTPGSYVQSLASELRWAANRLGDEAPS